jgi:hypothetical protein
LPIVPPVLIDADRAVVVVDVESRRTVLVPFETVEELTPAPGVGADGCGVRPVGARPHVSQNPPSAMVPSQPGRWHRSSETAGPDARAGVGVGIGVGWLVGRRGTFETAE